VIDPCVGDWIVVEHSGSSLRTRVDGVERLQPTQYKLRWDFRFYCRVLGAFTEVFRNESGWFLDGDREVYVNIEQKDTAA